MRRGIALGLVVVAAAFGSPSRVDAATPPSLRPGGPPVVDGLRVLAGSLHDHTTDSDGDTPSPQLAAWYKAHHGELGLDFATLTDHSDFFPASYNTPTAPLAWRRQAALSQQLSDTNFSLLRGFEFTNDQQNHLNVIGSQNWVSRATIGDGTLSMKPFYTWLTTPPTADPTGNGVGIGGGDGYGQFNHPGDKGALNWDDYTFDAAAAQRMATIEIHGSQGKSASDRNDSDAGWYWFALAKGWTVSPVMDFDFHDWAKDGVITTAQPGKDCGVKGYLFCQRTLVLAADNTRPEILNALRLRRTTASELPDLWATLRGPGGAWQGGTVAATPGSTITLHVDAASDTETIQSIDIIGDRGLEPDHFFDGDNIDSIDDYSHSQLTPSYVVQKFRYILSGGHATQKHRVDAAPKAAVVATLPVNGHRVAQDVTVRVPTAPSARPDGRHFFYAVVHTTNNGRAWTGPMLTATPPQGAWISGDTHVHDDHSSDGSALRQGISQGMPGNNSVADQIGQAERTGLGFLPLTDHRTYDQMWDPLWTSDKLVLVPGEEANGSPHATVLGASDEIVDGANPAGSAPYRHFQQSIWETHAMNGSWGTAHPDDSEWDNGKPIANASAVGVDTVSVWNRDSDPDVEIDYAENRWNRGYRFGVVGESDDHFKELWAVAGPGMPTTWVFAPQPTERGIVAGLRSGRTSVSSGPGGSIVTLTADMDGDGVFEAVGGDEVTAVPGAKARLKVRVQNSAGATVLVSGAPGRRVAPIATFRPLVNDKTYIVPIDGSRGWYRAEVRGPIAPAALRSHNYEPTNELRALTTPLFVDHSTRATPMPEVPMPPAASTGDAASTAVETPGAFTGFTDVAQVGADTHVVAETDADGGAQVAYQRLRSGALDGPRIVLSDVASSARFPAVAARGNDVWVVWQDEIGDQKPHRTDIVARHSADGGRTWDAERHLTNDGHAQRPAIALTNDGMPLVAWQDNVGGAFDIWTRILGLEKNATNVSAAGKTVENGNGVDTRSAIYPASLFPSLAVAPDGHVAVGWQDNRSDIDPGWTGGMHGEGTAPDDWEVFVASRLPTSRWTPPKNVSRDRFRADRHPSIAYGGASDLFAAWDSKELRESGVNAALRVAHTVAGAWVPPTALAFDAAAMSTRPQLTRVGDAVRAVWQDTRSADWRWSVWTSLLSPAGATEARRVTGPGNSLMPAIDGVAVSFTSDRHAARTQRDQTQGAFVVGVS